MKRVLLLASTLLMVATPLFAGKGKFVTKSFEVLNFTSVECSITCEVEYTVGKPSFIVSADSTVVAHITNVVKDGKLVIDFDKSNFYNKEDMKVCISSPCLNKMEISGAVKFTATNLVTNDIVASANGASSIRIQGFKATKALISANGAGSIKIDKVTCDDLTVNINGAGGGEIKNVNGGSIKVAVNGAGGCTVEGHADKGDFTINGVGGINIKKFTADKLTSAVNGIGKISYAD